MASKLVTLKRRSEFQTLTKLGHRVTPAPWLVMNYKRNDLGYPRFGWTIPSGIGGAVVRNRLRRWCREFIRSRLEEVDQYDVNFFFRSGRGAGLAGLKSEELFKRLEQALKPILKDKHRVA